MLDMLANPSVWAAFLTLTVLEIVLGVDNVIFISIASGKLPRAQRPRARFLGLCGALVLRVALLLSITWIIGLSEPVFAVAGWDVSWRDLILLAGGLFLLYKATTEIFEEVEGGIETAETRVLQSAFARVVVQIMLLDLVFSFDSVLTAVGIADHVEVMIAAVIVAIVVMMFAATPIAEFVESHPSTKMLALAFLVMVGMALTAEAFHVHVQKGFIYAAMGFSVAVECLNLWRQRRRAGLPASDGDTV